MQNAAETLKHDEAPSKVDQKHVTTFCNAGAHLMFLPRPPKHPESATGWHVYTDLMFIFARIKQA